jgi:hypothetical protein
MQEIRTCVFVLALLAPLNAAAQATQNENEQGSETKTETCTVEGTVVSAVTGERLKSAIVTLYNTQNVFHGAHALTDEHGHFVIKNAPAGSYLFRANKMGYVEQTYHPDSAHPALALVLEPGKTVEGILFQLARAGVILGRIIDEGGEPLANVEVEALVLQNRIMNRRTEPAPQIASVQRVWTDDRGAYRLFGLPSGSYYVRASDSGFLGLTRLPYGSGFNPVTMEGHPPVYFPGVRRLHDAQKIAVRAGQEVRIDFSLHVEKTYSISGKIHGADGKPVGYREATISEYDTRAGTGFSSLMAEVWTDEQGGFEFKIVSPGSYLVWIMTRDEDNRYWAGQHVEVADRNVSGVQLQMRPAIEVSGRVEAAEESKPDFQQTRIDLRVDGERDDAPAETAEVQKAGTFKFSGLSRTRHRLEVTGLPDGWYLRTVTFGNQNVQEHGLDLADDTTHELVIAISSGAARISGTVFDGDHPVPGAMVKLVPKSPKSQIMTAWTDPDGRFVMKSVAPGNYRILAAPLDDSQDEADDFGEMNILLTEKESKTVEIHMDKAKK